MMQVQTDRPGPQADAKDATAAMRAEQLRLYGANVPAAVGASVLAAGLLAAVLRDAVPPSRLLAWLALLALALGVRVLVWTLLRRQAGQFGGVPPRLLGLQLAVAGTGLAWGLAGVLLYPADDLQARVYLAFVLAGMAAGSLTLTAFDQAAALAFAGLALAPLSLRLFASGDGTAAAMGAMVLIFMAFLALTGLRAHRNIRETVALRAAETSRADTLMRSEQRLQQLSEQLVRKTEALELTLDSMSQGILSLDADGRTHFFNRRLTELLDLPESFLASHPTMDEIARYQVEHGHYGAGLALVDDSARGHLARWLGGERLQFPDSYFRRTLAGRMLEVKSRYLDDGGLVRTFTDVTDYFEARQRLQDSEAQARKLALVAAHTDNAVFIADAEGRIEWVNEGFTHLTGYRLEEVAGRRPGDVLRGPGTDPAEAARIDAQLARDRRAAGELVKHAKDGHPYWVALELHAILDDLGQVQNVISIERDITARKRAEEALRAARDEAERANQAKSDFLSAMSHELRTPMNAILGFAQLLESDPAHRLPERQRGHVGEILRAGSHLLDLVNDLLDLARVETGTQPISLEPVPVAPLLDDCLRLMQPVARERGMVLPDAVGMPCDCLVMADRTRLKQVLLNLLSNAIKYNRHGGHVELACSPAGAAVQIGVSDTGQGLNADQRERLFRPFERLGAEGGAIQGAGIGLVLSKRLVEQMKGRMGVDSEVGRGSTFWVRLPRAQAARAPARRPAALEPPGPATPALERARTVLYIEDNPVNVVLMESMLAREPKIRLVTALLPELGLELARAEHPALILLDIQLPGIDGFEVLRRLRADEPTRTTPVIAISANAMLNDVEHGLAAGFDAYLTKPLDLALLLTTVRQALSR